MRRRLVEFREGCRILVSREFWRYFREFYSKENINLLLLRRVMRSHQPDPAWVQDGLAYCSHFTHRKRPETWPCEEFIRADRASDGLIEARYETRRA